MIKKITLLTLLLFCTCKIFADEGLWLPSQIAQRINDMQSKGFKLTAEDIYSINNASLKDAVVHFGGGCTGEMISDKGLLITNHHCGFGQIQAHSSVEHDYLRDGFWAMKMEDELPNPGLTVSYLMYMKDVTEQVLKGYNSKMTEDQRIALVKQNSAAIVSQAEKEGKSYYARVTPLYYGNQYFLFVYQEFSDIRLVGAPPSSIGKFGGDTDNWMWPRHTGDFSLFRVYAGKDNQPAEYSKDNVPYKPKKSLKINASGIGEGSFTMVYGFPGRTNEYLMSDAVKYTAQISNPHKINLRTLRLNVQTREMAKDQAIRIKYASKNASVANAWKKWQGEMGGIIKLNAVANKQEYEKDFTKWSAGKPEYAGLIEKFHNLYSSIEELSLVADYQNEAINAVELVSFAGRLKGDSAKFYKNYYMPIDKDCFIALYNEYNKNIPDKYKSPYFKEKLAEYGSMEKWADAIFTVEPNLNLAKEVYRETNNYFNKNIKPTLDSVNKEISLLYRTYMQGQMEYNKANRGTKVFYPDANSTLRIAYGHVKGYSPSDAIYFTPISTLDGIMQKDNPNIYDYNIPQKLRDIYAAKDYGKWAVNGTIPVAFIATNHTSGGNSGSPVLDANGNLIGVNFDRVWEGTMSDVVFDPQVCRNIAIDIRYALFLIDRLAGAQRLLDEMDIIK
ncbi:MAG: S46 family peptidase [Bacteroidales bacterium]